jgi:hypothetical protein
MPITPPISHPHPSGGSGNTRAPTPLPTSQTGEHPGNKPLAPVRVPTGRH